MASQADSAVTAASEPEPTAVEMAHLPQNGSATHNGDAVPPTIVLTTSDEADEDLKERDEPVTSDPDALAAEEAALPDDADSEWDVDSLDGYREREDPEDVERRILNTIYYRKLDTISVKPSDQVKVTVDTALESEEGLTDADIKDTISRLPKALVGSATMGAKSKGGLAPIASKGTLSAPARALSGSGLTYRPTATMTNKTVRLAGPVIAANVVVPEEIKIEANKRGRQVKDWNWRDDITHHHVWWVIHSITNIVLLCIYFIPLAEVRATTLALANIMVSSLTRDVDLMAAVHLTTPYWPKFGRYHTFRMLHCIGGLHVAANLWAYFWLWVYVINEIILAQWLYYTVSYPWWITFTACPLPITMTIIIATAFPAMRRKKHDVFEMNHRYTRFTMLAFLLAHMISRNIYSGNWNNPNTYMVFILLCLATYPWMLVRKVPINNIYMSGLNHVVITYGKKMPAHGFVKISAGLNEWHAFGIAYVNQERKEFDLVITRAGDWTSKLLDACAKGPGFAPTFHYVRRRGIGFSYTLYAYERVLLVGTGGGIAASIGYREPVYPWCQIWILWIAKNHEKIYGPFYWDLVKEFGEGHYFVHDTKKDGRPGVVKPVELAKQVNAQAVYIVSNEEYTVKLRNACLEAGFDAYGAVWDS